MIGFLLSLSLWNADMNQYQSKPIEPGTLVRANDPENVEYGIVISCWYEDEIQDFDCYVAFLGDAIPEGKPQTGPYILRYAVTSLVPVKDLN